MLVAQVTEGVVAAQFAHRHPSRVTRYLLPNLHAMNFVLDDVLDGGVNDALNLDSHGKALSSAARPADRHARRWPRTWSAP